MAKKNHTKKPATKKPVVNDDETTIAPGDENVEQSPAIDTTHAGQAWERGKSVKTTKHAQGTGGE